MEKIILGLLMLRGMTVYELKGIISSKLGSMCASSAGSIHTAIHKLLLHEEITCVSEGRKKIYCITEKGRSGFLTYLETPMNHDKAKNIEESKIFFMGMVEPEHIDGLLSSYLQSLSEELSTVRTLSELCRQNKEAIFSDSEKTILSDEHNTEGIRKLSGRSMRQMVEDIYFYQMEILNHCADTLQFEIDWFTKLRTRRLSNKR